MTRKDYELIAKTLQSLYLGHDNWQRNLSQVANAFADTLAATNPRFDKQRFLEACGVQS